MKYQAVIFDLDGTAVDSPSHKQASSRLKRAALALSDKGVRLCAATGRPESYAAPMLMSMELHDPAIIAGGTRIINPATGVELWRCGLESMQVHAIFDVLQNLPYGVLWNDSDEDDYLNGGWSTDKFSQYDDTYYINICFVPSNQANALRDRLAAIKGVAATLVVSVRPNHNDIHVTNRAATKEHAIYELEKIIGVDKGSMIGVGDGHNDLHLFNAVGHKVAMGNAVDELKQCADEVIGSVKEDGLALYFENLAKEAL